MASILAALLWVAVRLSLLSIMTMLLLPLIVDNKKTKKTKARMAKDLENWLNENNMLNDEIVAAFRESSVCTLRELESTGKSDLEPILDNLKLVQRKKLLVCLDIHLHSTVAATVLREVEPEPFILSREVSLEEGEDTTATVGETLSCIDCRTKIESGHERCASCLASRKAFRSVKDVTLDPVEPKWNIVAVEEALVYPMHLPSFSDLITAGTTRATAHFPIRERCKVKVSPNPFSKSADDCCALYRGQRMTDNAKVTIRELLYVQDIFLKVNNYDELLLPWQTATILANEFNRIKPTFIPEIVFAEACLLQFMARFPEQPFMILTVKPTGPFEKYNNNSGYVAPKSTIYGSNHEAIQAFSHWSYEASNGNLLVVDCQGSYDATTNRFTLVDPAIHSKDALMYGAANLGDEGIRSFFASHECGTCCKALGLPHFRSNSNAAR